MPFLVPRHIWKEVLEIPLLDRINDMASQTYSLQTLRVPTIYLEYFLVTSSL